MNKKIMQTGKILCSILAIVFNLSCHKESAMPTFTGEMQENVTDATGHIDYICYSSTNGTYTVDATFSDIQPGQPVAIAFFGSADPDAPLVTYNTFNGNGQKHATLFVGGLSTGVVRIGAKINEKWNRLGAKSVNGGCQSY